MATDPSKSNGSDPQQTPDDGERLERCQQELIEQIEEEPEFIRELTERLNREILHPRGLLGWLGYRTSTG